MGAKPERIFLSSPHMGSAEQLFINDAFDTNWIAPVGPHLTKFEEEVAAYSGTKGAVAVTSGTAAIHLALRALGIGSGDVVFCSSFTFVASANPILYQGAKPVFIDSEPESWNMSPKALKRALEEAEKSGQLPKAIVAVNLYGQSADYDELKKICERYQVPIVEDAAESLGATYKGKASGTFGEFGIFSFNGNKIITTSNGGMIVSDDMDALQKIRFWSTQAKDIAKYYQHSETGYNYRLSNVLAGIGRGQLMVLDDRVEARRRVFNRYQEAFSGLRGIHFMPETKHGRSTRWLTALTLDSSVITAPPEKIIEALEVQNIETRRLWKPMHRQPLYAHCNYYPHDEQTSVCDSLFASGLCLPSGSNLTPSQQNRVIDALLPFFVQR
ncbi:aminotransferase class I/II-fold pyridoxal phosphate-dependent enzyme [Jeotgalibacillus sp. ET6]|uniref:DegT/DnrJ/EryC1/StrS family aminotransferase n=1 Tax=Jeotgalibacillus sp. ET6 TaxID=3037260 RepID=UPI00241860FD|nr:aminotransferase class I/II-fold pyridoxal phosphate-dependent enzyme [Jeotgalibacillus sp. ET6]MDG5471713.1 aminotransferase class I/II-fold pyridoxal phosphate-dependent enzyme [Jeotgalibacillus sp. ET6]